MASPAPTLHPGEQLASTVCATRLVVIRAPAAGRPVISCGGSPVIPASSPGPAPPASAGSALPGGGDAGAGTLVGKRYVDASETLELLCTASGAGELRCDGVPMTL